MKHQPTARERLASQRIDRRWSCGDLAAELTDRGCPVLREYLWKIENGMPLNRLDVAIALEDLFGIPVETWPRFVVLSRLFELRGRAA